MIGFIVGLVVTILIFIYFNIKINIIKRNQYESIKLLRDILETSFKKETAVDAAKDIVEKLVTKYNLDYCTIFTFNESRHCIDLLYTTAEKKYVQSIEIYANELFTELEAKENTDAKILSHNKGLDYPSAAERSIKYMYLIPLKLGSNNIGALLVENERFEEVKGFAIDFFKMVLENVSISLQHLLYFEKVASSANIDGLTQIYNRNYMNKFLEKEIKKYTSTGGKFCLVLFDIDYFKKFNDTHGHLFGDKVLKLVSKFVADNIRKDTDYIFRYGGEEFVIFLKLSDLDAAYRKIEEIRQGIENMVIEKEDKTMVSVTCSFGISQFYTHSTHLTQLIEYADTALYHSKKNGRNQVSIYNPSMLKENN